MRKTVLSALLLPALLPMSAAAQQNLEGPDAGPFYVRDLMIAYDSLPTWSAFVVPTHREFGGIVSANQMSADVQRAGLWISCTDSFAGPTLDVRVSYVFTDGVYPGDEYSLNLFNSVGSGRPAAYDIGQGLVRTDDIRFSSMSRDAPPQEYTERVTQFWHDLQNLGEDQTIEVRFEVRRSAGPYVQLFFPMTGFSEIVEQSAGYCPR